VTSTIKLYGSIFLLLCLGAGLYTWNERRGKAAETQSQVLRGQLIEKAKEAVLAEIRAQDLDAKAERLEADKRAAESKALAESKKSASYKAKYEALVVVGPLPIDPSSDPITLRDQLIAQQDVELKAEKDLNAALSEENENLSQSRDSWKTAALNYKEGLELSRKELRAKEIAWDAQKRANLVDKFKWGIIGFGAGYAYGRTH